MKIQALTETSGTIADPIVVKIVERSSWSSESRPVMRMAFADETGCKQVVCLVQDLDATLLEDKSILVRHYIL